MHECGQISSIIVQFIDGLSGRRVGPFRVGFLKDNRDVSHVDVSRICDPSWIVDCVCFVVSFTVQSGFFGNKQKSTEPLLKPGLGMRMHKAIVYRSAWRAERGSLSART